MIKLAAAVSAALALVACSLGEPTGRVDMPKFVWTYVASAPPPHVALFAALTGGPSSGQIATGTSITDNHGNSPTFSRASTTMCDGTTHLVAGIISGAPCIEPVGAAARPSTETLLGSTDGTFDNVRWAADGVTVTPGQTGPDGNATAAIIQDDNSSGNHRVEFNRTGGFDEQDYWFLVYVKPNVGGLNYANLYVGGNLVQATYNINDCTIGHNDLAEIGVTFGGTRNQYAYVHQTPDGWCIIGTKVHDVDNLGTPTLHLGHTYAEAKLGYQGTGTDSILAAFNWATASSEVRPFVINPARDVTATRAADKWQWTNPLGNSDTTWCHTALYLPDGEDWDQGYTRGLFQIGDTAGAANTASLKADGSGYLIFTVVDGSGTAKTLTSTHSVWSGKRVVRACSTAGTLSLQVGEQGVSTAYAGTVTGSGTGVIATQPAHYFTGSLGAATQFSGVWSDACLDTGATSCPLMTAYHPNYTPNTLLVLGDSISAPGPSDITYWPTLLATAAPTLSVTNHAIGGYSFFNTYEIWQSGTVGVYQWVHNLTGINDIGATHSDNGDNDQIFSFYKYMYDRIEANGSTMLLTHGTPCYAADGACSDVNQPHYQKLQDDITAWAAKTGHPTGDAYTSALATGIPPALACAYDYGTTGFDGCVNPNTVHLNQAGQDYLMNLIKTAFGF